MSPRRPVKVVRPAPVVHEAPGRRLGHSKEHPGRHLGDEKDHPGKGHEARRDDDDRDRGKHKGKKD